MPAVLFSSADPFHVSAEPASAVLTTQPPSACQGDFDFDLLLKYDLPVPRYTSYPTAPRFTPEVPAGRLLEALAGDTSDTTRHASLYFHLPFCESRCWFCGCTTVITKRQDLADTYLDHLELELGLLRPWLHSAQRVSQLHFGGGSPTFLSPAQIRRLGDMIHARHTLADDAEVSVEIDPRRLTPAQARAYYGLGCRRASLGVQDTDPRVQLAIHRIQPLEQTRAAFDLLRATGYKSISIDLIYGLPYQTEASFARTLAEVLALQPDRLAVFSYAHVPWLKPAQRILERDQALLSPEAKIRLLALAINTLTAAGFVHIGMDHFARAEDELTTALHTRKLQRNFQGYSTRAGTSIHAFGVSAISQTERSYRQNTRDLPAYQDALAAGRAPLERGLLLTDEDLRRRRIIMGLMCERRLDFGPLSVEFGRNFAATYAAELASLDDLVADGLVLRTPAGIELTPSGVLLVRVVAARFDTHLPAENSRANRFSRAL
jgi:oxygen-independent coproporphyrinogen-3 oxidase